MGELPSQPKEREKEAGNLVAAIIMKEQKFLMVWNIKYGFRIEPTGGKIEEGETLEKAAQREARQELGIEIDVGRLIGVYPTTSKEGPFNVHTLLCTIVSGEPRYGLEPKKIGGFEWYTIKELRACEQLAPNVRLALDELAKLVEEN
jgi:8-oxo-dGTP pyrophosphatase MutT (NUDIX family)